MSGVESFGRHICGLPRPPSTAPPAAHNHGRHTRSTCWSSHLWYRSSLGGPPFRPLFILPLSIFPSNKHLHTPLVTGGSSCACSSSEARLLAQQQLQAAVHLLAAVFGRQHHLDVTSGPGTCSARRAQPIPHSIRACPTPRDSNILRSRRSARSGGVGYSRIRVAIISDTMRRSSPSSFSCHTATSATSKADSLTSA